ncbi:MAG: glycoside hydrolase family 2 TIM barrel-domain containing protein [Candidatus Omnitrophota bacterium]
MKKFWILVAVILAVAAAGLLIWGAKYTVTEMSPRPEFALYDDGTEKIVDYEKYGDFTGRGAKDYNYAVSDRPGLAAACGEGVYPNSAVYKDPGYKELLKEKKLEGSHWNYIDSQDPREAFYKWAVAGEDPGVKQFYTALALESAGLITQAVKAYYSVVVNFPRTISYTYWNTPWYPGKAAIIKIRYLTELYPFLRMKLEGADVFVENGYNLDPADDVFVINPGRIVKCRPGDLLPRQDRKRLASVRGQVGYGNVKLLNYESGDWQFMVNGKPFIVKAVAYTPAKIGQSPDEGTLEDWMNADYNGNGRIDGPYDAWVDKNKNSLQDADEPDAGDFKLMKDMGVNTVRIYDHKLNSNKVLLRKMHEEYDFMVIMGDVFGAYAVGSGASWYRGTNYADPAHRERLKNRVREMVEEYKDEPYILMWMIGNENNYGVANSAKRFPEAYYEFANEVAEMIKQIDPNHPVAICNGDTLYLDIFAANCPSIDIYGSNSYRGWQGFGFWDEVKKLCGKPVIITEYGAPAYWDGHSAAEAEAAQAEYHMGCWSDILGNSAGYGSGNALGGVIFEWVDEWWKAYEPSMHDTHTQWPGPIKGGWIYEEWFGLTGQGDGSASPYMREIRQAYNAYRSRWNPSPGDRIKDFWEKTVIEASR